MITINTSPSGSPTVQDALWHVASSDNSGVTDFKFVWDVWVGGVQKLRVKQFPDPTTGKAYFDAGPTVRNSMTYEWFEPVGNAYAAMPNDSGQVAISYQVRVGEDFSGVTTLNLASGTTKAYNFAAPPFQRRIITVADKLNKWLTNRPLTFNAQVGENIFMPFYTNTNLQLKCTTYDANNSVIATATGSSTAITYGFAQMNIGTAAIAANLGITIGDNVRYYEVWFNSLDKVRVNIECNPKYTPILLHFVNRWGMYETMRFDLVNKLSMNVERKFFEQRDYRISGNSVNYISSGNRYYEGKTNYLNKSDWMYKLTANAMSDVEYVWAAELVQSPQVLMQLDGYFYPITIKSNNYEYSQYVFNRLKALEIDVEVNQTRYSQLR
jgi:hypothetical protein